MARSARWRSAQLRFALEVYPQWEWQMRRSYTALVICASILNVGCGSPTSGDRRDYEQLKGTRHVVATELYGKPLPAERVTKIGLRYTFDGDKLTMIHNLPGPAQTYTFAIDGSTN